MSGPRPVVHMELAAEGIDELCTIEGAAFVVLWIHGVPVAHIDLPATARASRAELVEEVAARIAASVGPLIAPDAFPAWPPAASRAALRRRSAQRLLGDPLGPGPGLAERLRRSGATAARRLDDLSIVVCTRDRPDQLARCLDSLARLNPPPREVVIVDNSAGRPEVQALSERHPHAIYVREPSPGLSRARNAGIRASTGGLIAFTDDDTVAREDWAARLVEPFDDPSVWSVTGLVLPVALATPAQTTFQDEMGGLNHGYRPMDFPPTFIDDARWVGPPVWHVGAGANMAIRRSAFAAVGLFDERLGAGAAGCSEDSEMWYRIMVAGGRCRYHPQAVVFHEHRESMDALASQAEQYMRGHMAALFVQFSRHRNPGDLRRALVTLTGYHARRALGNARRGGGVTSTASLRGFLRGWRFARLAVRNRPAPPLDPSPGS